MRTILVTLGLALLIPSAAAAQGPALRHTFLPAHKTRLSVDFGAKRALANIAQMSLKCDKVRTHRPAGFVELPIYGSHSLRTSSAAPCPAR